MTDPHGPQAGGRRLRRIGVILLACLALLALAVGVGGAFARAALERRFPPPGRLVAAGTADLHLHCVGQGRPAVVLEAGLMDFSIFWERVQPAVAHFTRVCAYDRAGLGWSGPGGPVRRVDQIAGELQALLAAAGVEPPLVLVGHSFGGLVVRRYATRWPDGVAGLVLVDSAHEDMGVRLPGLAPALAELREQLRTPDRLNALGLLALMPEQIPNRGLSEPALQRYRAVLATRGYFRAAIAESAAFAAELADPPPRDALGAVPLVVIRRGREDVLPGRDAAERLAAWGAWQEMQAELAGRSTNGRLVVAAQSGHAIPLEAPEPVIAAIRTLVDAARP